MTSNIITRLTAPFREFGFAGVLYGLDRVLQAMSPRLRLHVYELMVQPVGEAPLLPERFARNFQYRQIVRGDPEVASMPARADIKNSRFDQGAICLGAFRKERLIGYIWFSFDAYEEDEVRCTFVLTPKGRVVFDFDLYVFPDHRNGTAFAGIWQGANAFLRARGVQFSCSRLGRFNLASRRAHSRLGGTRLGRALFLQAWNFELMVATTYPYIGASWSARQRIRIPMHALAHPAATGR